MFNFLKSNKKREPLNLELRKYFENNLLWLMQEFPDPHIDDRRILTPTVQDFPINWNKSEDNAFEALKIVCGNMQIDSNEIELDFFNNSLREINMGASTIFLEANPENPEASGLYHPEKVNGKFHVSLDRALLGDPDDLVAVIAHELAHVKLLGGNILDENDEMLTDFATVFFGLGIFNANVAFNFYNRSDRWGYSGVGYLKVDQWAYALALYAFIRSEDEPEWKQFLSSSVKWDFENCLQYMLENEDEIFKFDDEEK
jgi:hypothetical protein